MKLDDSQQLFGVLDVTNGSVKNLLALLDRENEHLDGKLNGSVEIGGTRIIQVLLLTVKLMKLVLITRLSVMQRLMLA